MEVYYYDKIITDKGDVLSRWENDFSILYQGAAQTAQFDNEFLNQVIEQSEYTLIHTYDSSVLNVPITRSEVEKTVSKAKNGKAVSVDLLPNEIFKNENSVLMLQYIFNMIFNSGKIPVMWG